MKRKTALAIIKAEFAENGKCNKFAVRAMIEGGVSLKMFNEKARNGLEIYNKKVTE